MSLVVNVDRKLPASESYVCSKREVKSAFAEASATTVHFGRHTRFEIDPGFKPRPKLVGSVVATARIDRELVATIDFYPLKAVGYSEREHRIFVDTELSRLSRWTSDAQKTPEAQVVGERMLIIESRVDGYERHEVSAR